MNDNDKPRHPQMSAKNQKEMAEWVVKRDRGLSSEEADEFAQSNYDKEEMSQTEKAWKLLDKIPEDFAADLINQYEERQSKPKYRRTIWAAAAAVILFAGMMSYWSFIQQDKGDSQILAVNPAPSTQLLPDGSIVRLNKDTQVEVDYTESSRSVYILNGEAHFTVVENAEIPFTVKAKSLTVKALGTAFNVKLESQGIEVIVTEGTVQVSGNMSNPQSVVDDNQSLPQDFSNILNSGQKANVVLDTQLDVVSIDVSGARKNDLNDALAWRKSLLTLGGGTLEEIAQSFEQKTGHKLLIKDERLNSLRIGGRFPSDNVRVFLEILRVNYNISWSENADGTLVIGE